MNKKGFTLVELLMAMAFFSFILLFVVAGFIQINRSYTKGVTVRRVQDGARIVLEEVVREMRKSASAPLVNSSHGTYRLCLGNVRFGWNQQDASAPATDQQHSNETISSTTEKINFVKSYQDTSNCDDPFLPDSSTSPLDENVWIQSLTATRVTTAAGITNTGSTWRIKVVTSSANPQDGDFETFGAEASCAVRVGDQFCDVAELETVVSIRN